MARASSPRNTAVTHGNVALASFPRVSTACATPAATGNGRGSSSFGGAASRQCEASGITSRNSLSMTRARPCESGWVLPRQSSTTQRRPKVGAAGAGVKVRIGRARVSSLCCRSRRAAWHQGSWRVERRKGGTGARSNASAPLRKGWFARDRKGAADWSCGGKTTGESWRVRTVCSVRSRMRRTGRQTSKGKPSSVCRSENVPIDGRRLGS
jgi:hypothetical protein